MTFENILNKIGKNIDFEIECENGRKICVDRCNYTECWAVTTFEVVGTCWDSDYQARLPIRDLGTQRVFLTALDTANYVMSLF